MSTAKSPTAKTPAQRLPAPSLFVGPPSRNASSISLRSPPPTTASSNRVPLIRQRSLLGDRPRNDANDTAPTATAAGGVNFSRRQQPQQQQTEQSSNDRTDALWAEMQNTLEEVELSAINGTHVFGPKHSKALEELRTAQIALAQAWARSEAEEEEVQSEAKDNQERPLGTTNLLVSDRTDKLGNNGSAGGRPRSGTNRSTASERSQLEEETENDILLARQRREANDRYFKRINAGVLDVVAKLEEVAKAMKGVEQESKEIWGDSESIETGSVT